MALRILAFVVGAAIVVLTILSAVRTLLVPRALQAHLARAVFVVMRWLFRVRAPKRSTYEHRDYVMAFYAPVSLLALLGTWLVLVFSGFTLMFLAVGNTPLDPAFELSGSSLFTLGFVHGGGDLPTTVLVFLEAAMGLFLLALLITYLPSLYSAFQRREAGVSKLEVRAGRPPSGEYLLELAWTVGRTDLLHELWPQWEDWFVDIDESHTTFPMLVFFRSPHRDESWVTASGAILDGAALFVSAVDEPDEPRAHFMIRSGFLTLRHISDFFQIPYDPDPAPTDPISITREEFDEACERMAAAGVPLKPDRDRAWRDFAGWRVNYDAVLLALCRLTMAPVAAWSADRVEPGYYVPPLFPKRGPGGSGPPGGSADRS